MSDSFTQTDLDALNKAIASGELTVSYGDRTVTYRTIEELIKARALVMGNLSSGDRKSYTVVKFSKG